MSPRVVRIGVVLVAQLGLVAAAVAPQLSARLTGEEYLLRVAPYDPIDPFRGAYVDLTYPDLAVGDPDGDPAEVEGMDSATVFIRLVERDGVWVEDGYSSSRPEEAPYLACDNHGWRLACGIESWFLPQDEAAAFQEMVGSGDAVATARIDSRGNAALVAVEPR
jgi:uncharacterized membrane-anchored protein